MHERLPHFPEPLSIEQRNAIYENQTLIMSWLHGRGHQVVFARDPAVPRVLPPKQVQAIERGQPSSTASLLAFNAGKPCPYCSELMTYHGRRCATRDHLRPRALGGKLDEKNRVIACLECNGHKADLLIEEWLTVLQVRNDPRAGVVALFIQKRGAGL